MTADPGNDEGPAEFAMGIGSLPGNFGLYSDALLVGNFGDGKIHAYDLTASTDTGEAVLLGQLHSANGPPLKIDGLWALQFGKGGTAGSGPSNTLFFTAGPVDECMGCSARCATSPPGHH